MTTAITLGLPTWVTPQVEPRAHRLTCAHCQADANLTVRAVEDYSGEPLPWTVNTCIDHTGTYYRLLAETPTALRDQVEVTFLHYVEA